MRIHVLKKKDDQRHGHTKKQQHPNTQTNDNNGKNIASRSGTRSTRYWNEHASRLAQRLWCSAVVSACTCEQMHTHSHSFTQCLTTPEPAYHQPTTSLPPAYYQPIPPPRRWHMPKPLQFDWLVQKALTAARPNKRLFIGPRGLVVCLCSNPRAEMKTLTVPCHGQHIRMLLAPPPLPNPQGLDAQA